MQLRRSMSAKLSFVLSTIFMVALPTWVRKMATGNSRTMGVESKNRVVASPLDARLYCRRGASRQMLSPMPAAMNPDAVCACLSENTGRRQLMMMPKDAAAVPEGRRMPMAMVSMVAECVTALMARPASMRKMPLKSTKRGDLRTDKKPKTGCMSPKNSCPRAMMKLTVA